MIDSPCERCGRSLERMERQYLATIELRPVVVAEELEDDPADRDHLLELHELLESSEDDNLLDEPHVQEFLLCHDCCQRFREAPLTPDAAVHLGFSQN